MNKKDIQKIFNELKTLPVVLIPIVFICFLVLIVLGLVNSDSFINRVNQDDSYLQTYADNITATIINDDGEEKKLNLEVAQTERAIEQGLMNRTYLDYNSGMLFVYRTPEILTFWMKNTLISLDIIFISADKEIINISPRAIPLDEDINKHKSASPALFVIEVNGGWAQENNISAGNKVLF